MTRTRLAALGVGACGIAGLAAIAWVLTSHVADSRPTRRVSLQTIAESLPTRYAAESLARTFPVRDPFRLGRHPAAVAYNRDRTSAVVAAAEPPRPSLRLAGLVDAAHPVAVIEGLPGSEAGRLVAAGDRIGSFRITAIARGRVLVTGLDTTWDLTLRRR